MYWFIDNRRRHQRANASTASATEQPGDETLALTIVHQRPAASACCKRIVDPDEFLSDFGLRSLSQRRI